MDMISRQSEENSATYAVVDEIVEGFRTKWRPPFLVTLNSILVSAYRSGGKRLFDIVASVIMIVMLAPLMALIAAAVLVGSGRPGLFAHKRVGRNGEVFKCLKFRSMILGAEDVLQHLLAKDPAARAEWERDHKLTDDPRITRVGRILRATSLDELPQLFNVLRGDMSLVGPRPVTEAELVKYGASRDSYTALRPGITGLWQVCGRNDISYAQRIALDVRYVQRYSVLLDLKIMIKTVFAVIGRTGK